MLRDEPISLGNDFEIAKDISVEDGYGEKVPAHGLGGITAFITDELGGAPDAIDPALSSLPMSERTNKWGRYFVVVDADVLSATLGSFVSDDPGVWVCVSMPDAFEFWDQRRVVEFRT